MLKFLVDDSTGKRLANYLENEGYDAIYAGDKFFNATDAELLELSKKEKRILVTNDKDFGELVFRYKKPASGVILLRLKTDFPSARINVVLMIIKKLNKKLNNKFIVASEYKIRIKNLS